MRHRLLTSALLLATAGCGGASAGGGPSPSGALAIRMPSASSATFAKNDTVTIEVDTGMMGTISLDGTSVSTVALAFASDPAGFRTTATYEKLAARLDNPMAGPAMMDESDVEGQLAFTVDSRGRATVTDRFKVDGQAAQMVANVGMAHEFFVRLPGKAVAVGDSWVDTLTVDETMEGVTNTSTTVTRYTIAGDTMVAGVRLLKITTDSDQEMVAEGVMQGMSMSQTLSGASTGWLLWDVANGLLHSSGSTGELSGAMVIDMPGAPDMSMTLRSRSHTARAN